MAKTTSKRQTEEGAPFQAMAESNSSVDGLFPARPTRHVTRIKTPDKGVEVDNELKQDVHALIARHGAAAVLAAFRAVEREAAARTPPMTPMTRELAENEISALARREKWADRDLREPIADFLRRVYGDVLNNGLKQEHLRRIDSKLYDYVRKRDLPADLGLTTRWSVSEALIDDLHLPQPRSPDEARAMQAFALRWLRKFGAHQ